MRSHDHSQRTTTNPGSRQFLLALLLTLGFAAVEAMAGVWAHSLTLLGDAGHMATDGIALGVAALAAWFALRPASVRHSFGFGRAEVMAALLNTLFMVAIATVITIEAFARLAHPPVVHAPVVIVVAVIGLAVNFLIFKVLQRGDNSLNTRAAVLHVLGDILGSLAALIAGGVIYFTGWFPIDPLLSLFIAVLILVSALRLLRDASRVLLEGVPRGLDLVKIGLSMAAVDGVRSVHDLHVWALSSNEISLSAHIVIEQMEAWQTVLNLLREHLQLTYGIAHATLQPEPEVLARFPVESLGRRS